MFKKGIVCEHQLNIKKSGMGIISIRHSNLFLKHGIYFKGIVKTLKSIRFIYRCQYWISSAQYDFIPKHRFESLDFSGLMFLHFMKVLIGANFEGKCHWKLNTVLLNPVNLFESSKKLWSWKSSGEPHR